MESNWNPILDDALRQKAHETVFAIAEALESHLTDDGSLGRGAAGLALFFEYLAAAEPDRNYREISGRFLQRAVESVHSGMGPGLYQGILGIGWVAEHLRRRWHADDPSQDPNQQVDAYLHQQLDALTAPEAFDLIVGRVGWGLYALERLPIAAGTRALERIVASLIETSELTPQGRTWWTPAQKRWTPGSGWTEVPGCYDLGMAHGVPGVIAFLAQACSALGAPGSAAEALEQAVAWLLAQRRPSIAPIAFPSQIGRRGTEPRSFRSVWCYGDVGVAASLLCAARHQLRSDWEGVALDLARTAAVRSPSASVVYDACLCHGGAGQAHVFNRIYQSTLDPLFKQAAQTWIEFTLDQRKEAQGVAGFVTQMGEGWLGMPGMLEGAAGMGLALLAATTPVCPEWDQVFLVSIPSSPAAMGLPL